MERRRKKERKGRRGFKEGSCHQNVVRNEREGGFEEERRGKRCCGMELKREVYVLWWQEGERSEVSVLAEDQEVGGVGRG